MTSALGKYMTLAVPRYTSDPTAPQFDDSIDGEAYGAWLARLDPAEPISLYLHVPFCDELCWYCGCNMKLAARYGPVAEYLDSLIGEIDLVAARLSGRLRVSHLHWGGGTPTSLKPDDLARAMQALRARFDFTAGAEIAIESDPRTLTAEMIERIGALGFNRASFGVQEFDPKVQRAINRIQPPELVAKCVEGLRAVGVADINFDLIYGLPHQSVETITATVARCAEMAPDRLALFGYAHVPWMAKKQRLIDEAALPGAEARLAQARAAAEKLEAAGYLAIGLDHFAKPEDPLAIAAREGRLRRNFQGYTTDQAETLLGFGATAIGRTPEGYVQNIAETGAWARAIAEGRPPIGRGRAFAGDDKLRGAVIEQLMCVGAVDTAALGALHEAPPDWCASELESLAPMTAEGLLSIEAGRVEVTEAGRPLVRVVAAAFDRYHAQAQKRHSVAV